MKRKFAFFLVMVLSLPILATQMAHAQSDETIRADIPFDFYAGEQPMPAGTYSFRFDLGSSNVQMNGDARHAMFLLANDIDENKASTPSLVFDHSGDHYFLKTIATFDGDINFSVKNAEKRLARNTSASEVVVAANLH
jgi:hypothetical protein